MKEAGSGEPAPTLTEQRLWAVPLPVPWRLRLFAAANRPDRSRAVHRPECHYRLVFGSVDSGADAQEEHAPLRCAAIAAAQPVLRRAASRRDGVSLAGRGAELDRREFVRPYGADYRLSLVPLVGRDLAR